MSDMSDKNRIGIDRRQFLFNIGLGAAILNAGSESLASGATRLAPNDKINVAGIGVGSQGGSDIDAVAAEGANIVALCDVDSKYAAKKFAQYPNAKQFRDYRVMLDQMGKQIDAVVIGTPDHAHAVITMEAMRHGKHVYCEKPLTHTIHEARAIMAGAHKYKVVTQLGNQGHSFATIRKLCEWVWAGAIGKVHTVYAGCGEFKEVYSEKRFLDKLSQHYDVPPELDYDMWVGPVQFKPYTPYWVPWNWRGWMHFGTGCIGDWFCHVIDPSFWALDLGAPTSIMAEVSDYNVVTDGETYPPGTKITYQFPAKKDRGPVKLVWHDGNTRIPAPEGLPSDEEVPRTGAILIGDKGMIVHGSHGAGGCHLVPDKVREQYSGSNAPAETIPRVKNHHWDWLEAIRTGRQAGSNFDYGGRLTQVALLGAIAIRFAGQTLNWDDHAVRFTNNEAANAYINPAYRKGWKLA